MDDDQFFTATDELKTISQWARARYAARWAVLGAVLLRVAATTEPNVQLPATIGGRASLNLLAAFVSPSGGGKGISDKVARLAWPAPLIERPIGSGEGIAATFVPPKKEGVEPVTRAIISVPEIDTLAGLASRQGSILLAQLKSLAMGEQLGQANASEATTRIIPEHTYRACLSVGAQPAHTGVLFNDTTGGTPQRFLWFLTIDPDMPDDRLDDPAPLNTKLPMWTAGEDGVVEIAYGPPVIAETIVAAHLARQRGDAEALDGHAMLTRCKVAAALAILHHRSVVSELDWELSGHVMEQSNRTRDWVIAETKKVERQKIRARAQARAAGEEFISDRKLDRAKAAVVRWLDKHEELPMNDLRKRARSDWRDQVSAAVAELVDDGLILEIPIERGHRYRINRGVHPGHGSTLDSRRSEGVDPRSSVDPQEQTPEVHAVPEVQPSSSQVTDAVPEVQRVPPRSQLHVVDTPAQTSVQWLSDHIAQLLAAGTDTIESTKVYNAGQAAGYKIDALRQAAKKSDDIAIIERRPHTAIWRLGAGSENTAITAEQWLTDWLEPRGWTRATDAYAAGAQAGYSRNALKAAANRGGVLKRGSSILTEWRGDIETQETA